MISRALSVARSIAAVCVLFTIHSIAVAQATLTAITVTSPQLTNGQTGGTGALIATGTFSDQSTSTLSNVTWTSSSPAITVNPLGLATFVYGDLTGTTITATSGAISGSIVIKVLPQTTMYATDGQTLDLYDITLQRIPIKIKTVSLAATGLNNFPIAMVLSPDGTQLYIANPAYENPGTYAIYPINTSTLVVGTAVTSTCRPTGMAVKSNFLFVAESGRCGQSGVQVSVYNTSQNLQFVESLSAATLAPNNPTAIPLVAAASLDPNDQNVYIGSTSNYSGIACGSTCIGTLTTISTANATPAVTASRELNFGTDAAGYSIAPLGLAVTVAYPSTATAPIHTVFIVGPGFNSVGLAAPNPTSTNGMYFEAISGDGPQRVAPVPQSIFLEPGPISYVPIATSVSTDGLTTFASDGGNFVDSFTSQDGRSFSKAKFFSTGGAATCDATCQPLTSLATTADGQYLFAGFQKQINRLDTSTLASNNATPVTSVPLALTVTQAPEVATSISSQNGTHLVEAVTLRGNFLDPFVTPGYGVSTTDPNGQQTIASGNIPTTSSFPLPQDVTVDSTGNGATSIQASISNTFDNLGGTFLTTVPVGPVTVTVPTLSNSTVTVGGSVPIVANVQNAIPATVTWIASVGSFAAPSDSASGAPIVYTAPASINSSPTTVVLTATSDVAGCTGGGCQTTYSLSVVAPTVTVAPTSLSFASQAVGTASAAQSVVLTNTSKVPLTIAGVSLSGTNAADFALAQNGCGARLAAGASCTIEVTFTPQLGTISSRSAILSIADNTLERLQTIGLSGTAGSQSAVTVTVTPSAASLGLGATAQFSATVQGATNQAVTWQVNGVAGGNATLGTVSTTGLYTAPVSLPSTNTLDVTAVSVADPTKSGSAIVTLQTPASITLSPGTADVQAGNAVTFTATVLPAGTNPAVTWSLSGSGCTGTGCGTLTGVAATTVTFTANPALSAASVVQLTATSEANPSNHVSEAINVYLAPALSVTTQSMTVTAGGQATYTLTLAAGTGDPNMPLTIQCNPKFLPNGVTCVPLTVQPGPTAQTVMLTLATTGPQSVALPLVIGRGLTTVALVILFPFGMFLAKGRRLINGSLKMILCLVLALLSPAGLVMLSGCGTNGSFGPASAKNSNETPIGTFTIHIQGNVSGLFQDIAQVTLVVQ